MDSRILQLLQLTANYFHDQHRQAYLVGGSIRNILLDVPCVDLDIVTSGDIPMMARRLADTLGGHYAYLHARASRVIVPLAADIPETRQNIIFDISPLTGTSIEHDLRQRDFTINAIATPLAAIVQHFATDTPISSIHFIDPLHGIADIEARRIRAVDNNVFRHDPLRILRAVRFMAHYHMYIDSSTQGLMLRDATLLPTVAPERIHEEFYAILGPDGATERLRFLDAHGLLTILIPEFIAGRGMPQPYPHHWDVLEHSLETIGKLEQLATLLRQPPEITAQSPLEREQSYNLATIHTLLDEAEQQGIFQYAMLTASQMKLAALLHDIGKPITYTTDEEGFVHFYGHPQAGVPVAQQILRRLHASTQDRRLAQQVAAHHMRPGQLGQDGPVTLRAIRRYFLDLGPTGILIAIFSLADHLATIGPQPLNSSWDRHIATIGELLTHYIRHRERLLPPLLIPAEELIRRLKLTPGPHIGRLLDAISEAQAEGKIHSKEEAFWVAEEKLLEEKES